MSLPRKTRAAWMAAVAVPLIAVAGCSGDGGTSEGSGAAASSGSSTPGTAAENGELEIPSDADEETKKAYVQENALAACMRKQGFTYTPRVTSWDGMSSPVDAQDYQLAKEYREKYGFGIFAAATFPNDPNVLGSKANMAKQPENPDATYLAALSPAQRKAYDKALGSLAAKDVFGDSPQMTGCSKVAHEAAYGPEKSAAERHKEQQAAEERDRAAGLALNGDPELVRLAQEYASCLRGEGIEVTTTQPTAMSDMVKFQVSAQVPMDGMASLDQETGRERLTAEIDRALKDLECGKAFRAAYFPKLEKNPYTGMQG
ncbi:hypothetical protein [Streptomyces sp. NPDC016675]|uniref:hypothetical protein n=1 Tax=Streptomyces sp. NPDC016675 TaxID=3364970 RepID=UPI0036FE6507